jgi:protein SCO1
MDNPGGIKKIIILLLVLVVPAIGYLLLRTGTNHYKSLPVYGERYAEERVVDGKTVIDTVYHTIRDFALTDQSGKTITQDNLKDVVYVADFFFVDCQTICPKMSTQMSRIQEKFKNNPEVKLISHSVNPEADSVPVLARYAQEYKAIPDKWHLLTGSKKQIYDLARNDYLVNALQGNAGPDDFIHTELFVLIDKEKKIRGYYDGTSAGAVDTLIDEIKVLMKEEISKK